MPTLAEELKKTGYRTGAIVGGPLLHSVFGMDRGFDDYYDENLHSFKGYEFYRRADETTRMALRWLTHHLSISENAPFFLFLNYYDPHNPYRAPEPWGDPEVPPEVCDIHSGRYDEVLNGTRELTEQERAILTAQYDNEIKFMDFQIGRLLFEMKQLELYDSTLIIVTSDHGESFGEHRLLGHGRALYEELVRVPLIVKYPMGDQEPGVVSKRVSIASIMPTILERVGQRVPANSTYGTLDRGNQMLVAECYRDNFWIEAYGVRFDRDLKAMYETEYKWIWNSDGGHELYNVLHDPDENKNLRGELPLVENRLQSRLAPLTGKPQRKTSSDPPLLDENLKRRLKALGYMQ